ncbi:MAG: hypothetical protein KTR30_24080 [Saprospiraceae bacterium]|nr:hypothetical protein [Saprospiraceae bacterium]
MKKEIGKYLIYVAIILLVRETGLIDLNIHQSWFSFTSKVSNIPKGGLLGQDFSIELDWGSRTEILDDEGESLRFKVTSFNNWDPVIFRPISKVYHPIIHLDVYNAQDHRIGEVKLVGKLKSKGLISRQKQLKIVKENVRKALVEFVSSRQLEDARDPKKGDIKWRCQTGLLLYPILQLRLDLKPLLHPQTESLYCLRYDVNTWKDTLYYEDYYRGVDSLIGYEVATIKLENGTVEQVTYYNDGQVARITEYLADPANDSHLNNVVEIGPSDEFQLLMPKTKRIRMIDRQGNTSFQKDYDY